MATLGIAPGRLATPNQVHGTNAAIVDTVWPTGQGPEADAVVTDRRGIAVGVVTADCGPVLFADAEAHVVGAAHAGWRGALAGILDRQSPRWSGSAHDAETSSRCSDR